MFESISRMREERIMRRKQEEEEDERFAALVNADAQKYRQELEAESQRKREQIVARRQELDRLKKRDSAIQKDSEIPLAVLAINKPLLDKVHKANVADVTNYLKKVEKMPPGRGRRRRHRRHHK